MIQNVFFKNRYQKVDHKTPQRKVNVSFREKYYFTVQINTNFKKTQPNIFKWNGN